MMLFVHVCGRKNCRPSLISLVRKWPSLLLRVSEGKNCLPSLRVVVLQLHLCDRNNFCFSDSSMSVIELLPLNIWDRKEFCLSMSLMGSLAAELCDRSIAVALRLSWEIFPSLHMFVTRSILVPVCLRQEVLLWVCARDRKYCCCSVWVTTWCIVVGPCRWLEAVFCWVFFWFFVCFFWWYRKCYCPHEFVIRSIVAPPCRSQEMLFPFHVFMSNMWHFYRMTVVTLFLVIYACAG